MRAKLHRMILWSFAFVLGAIAAAEAFDGVNVHAPGTGQTVVMSQSTPGSLLNNPGMAFTTSGARFEFGYTRRYDLAELDRLHFAVAARKGAFSLAGGLSQSGKTSLYSERIVKATISMERGRFAFGLTGSSMAVQFGNNYGRFNAFTLGGGVGIRSPQVLASLAVDNITRPKLYDGAPPYPRLAAFNLELLTKKKLSLMVRTVMTESEKPRVGLGQRIPLAKRSALYWGVSTRPLEYGGGIDIGTPRFVFTYAASIHPVLGFSHTISLGLGTKSAKVEPPGGEEGDF